MSNHLTPPGKFWNTSLIETISQVMANSYIMSHGTASGSRPANWRCCLCSVTCGIEHYQLLTMMMIMSPRDNYTLTEQQKWWYKEWEWGLTGLQMMGIDTNAMPETQLWGESHRIGQHSWNHILLIGIRLWIQNNHLPFLQYSKYNINIPLWL